MFDVIAIGGATVDIFVESDTAHIINVRGIDKNVELYCLEYGAKVEIDRSSFELGGGGINVAVNFANLGLKTAALAKMGKGSSSQDIIKRLESKNICTNPIIRSEDRTGFSIILTSFEGDRTVLAHRGANATLSPDDINFEKLKNTKWIYSAPLSCSLDVLLKIAEFAKENNINFAYNLGSKALKASFEELIPILKAAKILTLNTKEASIVTGIQIIPEIRHKSIINPSVKEMMRKLKEYVQDIVIVTDGKNGAYAYDGTDFYYAEMYPGKAISSLGAGDAFASTFTASIIKNGGDIKKALALASINSAYVVQKYSSQEGLQSMDKLEEELNNATDYEVITVNE